MFLLLPDGREAALVVRSVRESRWYFYLRFQVP